MTTISDGAFSQGDVMRRIADLERMVANLSTSRRLESASIGQGGVSITNGAVKIYDADDFVRAQIGKLPDGSYDIAAVDPLGQTVSLGALAFGMQSATVDAAESTSSTTPVDLTTFGPTLTTTIGPSGRCLVTVSASISWVVGPGGGSMYWIADGANFIVASQLNALTAQSSSAGYIHSSFQVLLENLSPGDMVFTAQYASETSGNSCQFAHRNLTVQPF